MPVQNGQDIGLDPVGMGYILCLLMGVCYQADPAGCWMFGSTRRLWSIFIWSMFTLLQGFVDIFSGFGIIVAHLLPGRC